MFYVKIKTLPGIRADIFFFYTMEEASEFASCLHAKYGEAAETEEGEAGQATDVFEHWSF